MEEVLTDLEPTDDREVYGVRVMFVNPHTDETVTVLMDWLTYDKRKAGYMRQLAVSGVYENRINRVLHRVHPEACEHWTSVAARVVRLAEIPF